MLQPAVDFLRQACPDLQAVYLFGSHARHEIRPDSDIDLAILLPAPLDLPRLAELSGTLTTRYPDFTDHVDLIDLRRANPVLAMQVMESGQILYQADPAAVQEFELQSMTRYCDLQFERRDILRDVAQRGTILQ